MSDGLDKEVGSDAWWESRREDLKDLHREYGNEGDTPEIKAARSYLGSRLQRKSIEMDTGGDKLMAIPYRLAELFKARRLAVMLDVEFGSRPQRDDLLPTLARMTIDQVE